MKVCCQFKLPDLDDLQFVISVGFAVFIFAKGHLWPR